MAKSTEPSIPTRYSLLRRLKEGIDEESWREFFATYRRLIHDVALEAGLSEAEAQDAVQETAMVVTRRIHSFVIDPERGSFKAWLLRITRRRVADQFRRRRLPGAPETGRDFDDAESTAVDDQLADPASLNVDAAWEEHWREMLLEQALQRVRQQASPKEFLLFHQQVVKELPARLVANRHGVSLAAVYVAKYRIQQQIKREVRKLQRELG